MTKYQTNLTSKLGALISKSDSAKPASDAAVRSAVAPDQAAAAQPKTQLQGFENPKTDEIVNLSFKVQASFRKKFKMTALTADMSQHELLHKALALWIAVHERQR